MSKVQVSNIIFNNSSSNRIVYTSGNVSFNSTRVTVSGKMVASNGTIANAFISSSNSSYYMSAGDVSPINDISVFRATPASITHVSKNGLNGIFIIMNGKLYSTSGKPTATWASHVNGRGTTAVGSAGLESFYLINFPTETGTLVKADVYGEEAYALFSTGNLYTWGYNYSGQLGLGDTSSRGIPTLAATNVTNVWTSYGAAEYSSTYGRIFIKKSDNYIYAAGYNGYGQLGDGTTTQRNSFTQLTGLGTTVTSVWPIGTYYGCTFFQKSDNSIWACGLNGFGQLGNGNTTNQSTPVNVTANWGGAVAIEKVVGGCGEYNGGSAYGWGHVGILQDNGSTTTFKMAGYNGYSQLGDGTTTSRSTPITPNVGAGRIADVNSMGGGVGTIMLLKENGDMYNWGYNGLGQLGDGTTVSNATPTLRAQNVTGIFSEFAQNYQSHWAAAFYTKADGLYAAGYNGYAQCGLGHVTSPITTFTKVKLPYGFTISKLGHYASAGNVMCILAVGLNGRMFGWGYNANYEITADYSNDCLSPIHINTPIGA